MKYHLWCSRKKSSETQNESPEVFGGVWPRLAAPGPWLQGVEQKEEEWCKPVCVCGFLACLVVKLYKNASDP